MIALACAIVALALADGPGPDRVPPRARAELGEDERSLVVLDGRELVTWDLVDAARNRRPTRVRLPAHPWLGLSLAPRTDGLVERAVVYGADRLALVHLGTGRVIADWRGRPTRPLSEAAIRWAPDGTRFATVGWPIGRAVSGGDLPIRWVDAALGSVVVDIDVPGLGALSGVALLGDRTVVLGTEKRLVLLGPGPEDARTIGVGSGTELLTANREGLIVRRRGNVSILDPQSGAKARELASISSPIALDGAVTVAPGGRRLLIETPSATVLVDLVGREAVPLTPQAGLLLLARDSLLRVGKKSAARFELLGGVPEALRATRVCLAGTCKSGEGALLDLVTKRHYAGAFAKGEPSGRGILRYEDGSIFEGSFKSGRPHGKGRLLVPGRPERAVLATDGELVDAPP